MLGFYWPASVINSVVMFNALLASSTIWHDPCQFDSGIIVA